MVCHHFVVRPVVANRCPLCHVDVHADCLDDHLNKHALIMRDGPGCLQGHSQAEMRAHHDIERPQRVDETHQSARAKPVNEEESDFEWDGTEESRSVMRLMSMEERPMEQRVYVRPQGGWQVVPQPPHPSLHRHCRPAPAVGWQVVPQLPRRP